MPDVIYLYPRGFLSCYTNAAPASVDNGVMLTTNGVIAQYIDGIYGIDEIYGDRNPNQVDTILKAISLSAKLFGSDFNSWLDLQLTSPTISAECLSFIEDTVLFIREGKRIIPVVANQRTIQDVERSRYNTEKLKYVSNLNFKDFNTVSILCDWIAQPNGLEDLRYTLEILFGDEKLVERSIPVQPKPGVMHF